MPGGSAAARGRRLGCGARPAASLRRHDPLFSPPLVAGADCRWDRRQRAPAGRLEPPAPRCPRGEDWLRAGTYACRPGAQLQGSLRAGCVRLMLRELLSLLPGAPEVRRPRQLHARRRMYSAAPSLPGREARDSQGKAALLEQQPGTTLPSRQPFPLKKRKKTRSRK